MDRPLGLARETDGVVYTEYVTLLFLVVLTAAAAVIALGRPLLRYYRYVQMVIAVPVP
jgi:hypothetical protein